MVVVTVMGGAAGAVWGQKEDPGGALIKQGKFVLGKEPVTVTLDMTDAVLRAIKSAAASQHSERTAPTFRLRVDGFRPPRDAFAVGGRVFLNLPGEPKKWNDELLSDRSPYYVGSFRFGHEDGKEQGFYLRSDLTRKAFQLLIERDELDKAKGLRVTIVGIPRPAQNRDTGKHDAATPFSEVSLTVVPPKHE